MENYTGSFVVKIDDVDCADRLKFSSLCTFLQECSRLHGEEMGLGVSSLKNLNQTWLLNSIRIELKRQPKSGEFLTIITGSRGTKGLRALRDFKISTSDGEVIGAASSEWILIDKSKMRPCRPGEQFPILTNSVGEYPLDQAMGCFDTEGAMEVLDERHVRFNEIDFNGHVNNSRYVSWIEDTIGRFLLDGHRIKAIELHFLQSAKLNDQVSIQGTHAPYCQLANSGLSALANSSHRQIIQLQRVVDQVSTSLVRACVDWA